MAGRYAAGGDEMMTYEVFRSNGWSCKRYRAFGAAREHQ